MTCPKMKEIYRKKYLTHAITLGKYIQAYNNTFLSDITSVKSLQVHETKQL